MTRATYVLEEQQIRKVESMAKRLGISHSAAVRIAIDQAHEERPPNVKALKALKALGEMDHAGLDMKAWEAEARAERRASRY